MRWGAAAPAITITVVGATMIKFDLDDSERAHLIDSPQRRMTAMVEGADD